MMKFVDHQRRRLAAFKIGGHVVFFCFLAAFISIFSRQYRLVVTIVLLAIQRNRWGVQSFSLSNKVCSLPSRELTYPTLGKGKSSSKVIFDGIC